jgi:hypothetical protein
MNFRNAYYLAKPLLPRSFQIAIRRKFSRYKLARVNHVWPILESAFNKPDGWLGWPQGKRFALVLTHDVDTAKGQTRCKELMIMEKKLGFVSSFNFVPERYKVDPLLREKLVLEGFEVGVHGLNHDGKLYQSREIFRQRAQKINAYIREWGAAGFRSPSMHHNLEWLKDLDVEYDSSTFDTDPFEPQSTGVETIFPFIVNRSSRTGYVEMPYTLPQDFTLFVLLLEKTIDIWKKKLDWIVKHGGMALLNSHPDYMAFEGRPGMEEYPADYYRDFLVYVKENYSGDFYHVLPKDLARFWRSASVHQ